MLPNNPKYALSDCELAYLNLPTGINTSERLSGKTDENSL